jgi:hypothetical protein
MLGHPKCQATTPPPPLHDLQLTPTGMISADRCYPSLHQEQVVTTPDVVVAPASRALVGLIPPHRAPSLVSRRRWMTATKRAAALGSSSSEAAPTGASLGHEQARENCRRSEGPCRRAWSEVPLTRACWLPWFLTR